MTALMAAVIEGFKPTGKEMLSLTVLSAGVMIAIYEGSQAHGTTLGLAACIAGKAAVSLQSCPHPIAPWPVHFLIISPCVLPAAFIRLIVLSRSQV